MIAITAEVLLGAPTGFDLLLLGLIFMIGGGVGVLTGNFVYALIVVTILSFLYILLARNALKSRLNVTTTKTNTENLMGKKAVVVKKILPTKAGQVKVEGEIWRAESNVEVDVDKEVIIESVSGVTLKVN